MKEIGIAEFRRSMGDYLEQMPVKIMSHGKPIAVLVDYRAWDQQFKEIALKEVADEVSKDVGVQKKLREDGVGVKEAFYRFLPILRELVKCNSIEEAINKSAAVAYMKKFELLMNSDSERLQDKIATDILNMAGFVPVTKNLTVNADMRGMSHDELKGYISSKLDSLSGDERKLFYSILERNNGTLKAGSGGDSSGFREDGWNEEGSSSGLLPPPLETVIIPPKQ